jgi:hypothetical protein
MRFSLVKNPDARWQTAADVMEELKWITERPAEGHRLERAWP